jgi:hypothetical protein
MQFESEMLDQLACSPRYTFVAILDSVVSGPPVAVERLVWPSGALVNYKDLPQFGPR